MKKILLYSIDILIVTMVILVGYVLIEKYIFIENQSVSAGIDIRNELDTIPSIRNSDDIIIVFTDYECPYCEMFDGVLNRVSPEINNRSLTVVHYNFPLSSHVNAYDAAIAVECAGRNGSKQEYHDAVVAKATLSEDSIYHSIGEHIFNDQELDKFNQCLNNRETSDLIDHQLEIGFRLGVKVLPSFIIKDKLYSGLVNDTQLIALLN